MTKRFKYITVDLGRCVKVYTLDDHGKLLTKRKPNPKRNMKQLIQEISTEPMEPEPTKEDTEVQVQTQIALESPTKGGSP